MPDYINEHVKQPKTTPLAGNSIATRPRVHRPRHAHAGLVSHLPNDRRQLDQGTAGAGICGSTSAAAQGADLIGRWPTSTNPSANCGLYRRTAFVPQPGPSTQRNRGRRRRASDGAGAQEETDSAEAPQSGYYRRRRSLNTSRAAGGHGGGSSLVEHQVVILGVAGFESRHHPNRAVGRLSLGPCCPCRGLAPANLRVL